MSKLKLFVVSLLLATGGFLGNIYLHRPKDGPKLVHVTSDVSVTSQLQPDNVRWLRREGVRTLVDIRPDGEADDQAPSSRMKSAAERSGLEFHYIPVPHEGIPKEAVDALGQALSAQAMPTVLYCRTGRRAVRLFALVEATRTDGPQIEAILEMVRATGFSADDLKGEIAQRFSQRQNPSAVNP